MKVLMFSTDKNIFIEGSEVQRRMVEYGSLVEELHIIIKSQNLNLKSQNFRNVFVYPTNDRWKFLYFINAYKIGKKIISKLLITNYQLLITCQDPFETGLVACLLKRKFELLLQVQIHTDFLSQYFWRESFKNKVRVFLAKQILKRVDNIRVVSERIKKSLISELGISVGKVSVLAIFVDIEGIKNTEAAFDLHKKYPGKFIILMASRLTKEKNIDLALEVMRGVIKQHPSVLLLIVGDGPEREALKLQITNYKLQKNVVLEPWTNNLSSYYKTADLFLLTSNYEGYGRTVVEAMAAGLPVVMTDVGLAVGSVVPVGDKDLLTQRLNYLIENKFARENILNGQIKVLGLYDTKEVYLNLIKKSWENCFL